MDLTKTSLGLIFLIFRIWKIHLVLSGENILFGFCVFPGWNRSACLFNGKTTVKERRYTVTLTRKRGIMFTV